MSTIKTEGNCYICGKKLGKTAMKNHIMKEHAASGNEECLLLKIEGNYSKEYWIFADIPKNKTFNSLDTFLRKIWLECCGHLSDFRTIGRNIGKTRKFADFHEGDKFTHEYDMGSTTESLITVVGDTRRPIQRSAIRLLARNVPPAFECVICGKPAVYICQECMYDLDNPYYCKECAENHEHDALLPITNSPRCGVCGYDGALDSYVFKEQATD